MSTASIATQPRKRRLRELSQRTVETIARWKDEPAWLIERRLEAWRHFQQLPMPALSQEAWRRIDLSDLQLDSFAMFTPARYSAETLAKLPRRLRPYLRHKQGSSGLLVQHDSEAVYQSLEAALDRQGVIFTSLDQAVREHPGLVERYLLTECIGPGHNKFVALNGAMWSGGVFLYVPPAVRVELPFHSVVWNSTGGSALFPHSLIVVERGASVTYLDEFLSAPNQTDLVMNAGVVEVYLEDGAELNYVTVQEWGRNVFNLSTQRVLADRHAKLHTLMAALGSRLTKHFLEVILRGDGAEAQLLGLLIGEDEQHFDHEALQDHLGSNTVSNLLFKAALTERAGSIFSGLVHIHKNARRTDSFVENRNLVLSDSAKADSIPKLEIETSDVVRCGHGSTVGQVDEQQLFYLMSRGLTRREAEKVILNGFFEPLLLQVPLEDIRHRLATYIERRL